MTTIVPFLPSNMSVPSFLATLDGDNYRVYVTWNVSAQRYYIDIYTQNDEWVITTPMCATPPARRIESASYNPFRGVMTAKFVSPNQWPIPLSPAGLSIKPGTIVDYTLENFAPNVLNQ